MKTFIVSAPVMLMLSASAATFTVTNTNDSGPGSLRDAIALANASPGADQIGFNLPGTNVQTIAPLTALPAVTNTLNLDGYSQPGSQANTLANGSDAVLRVRLDGGSLPALTPLLKLSGYGHSVRGLVIVRATGKGIHLENCSNTTIAGNWIGLDVDNLVSGNSFEGIYVTTALGVSSGNVIGGTAPADRNVISGNRTGIYLFTSGAFANVIAGNFIGTDATGTLPRGNFFQGVYVQAGTNNVIGGSSAAARNIISGNGTDSAAGGIYLLGGTATRVQNNFIGTDVSGTYDLGNGNDGIIIQNSSISACVVGGVGAGNLICNNRGNGIFVLGASTNVFLGNTIGTDATGLRQLGNSGAGIRIFSGVWNTIGGVAAGAANTIRFNYGAGVELSGGTNNAVRGNVITDNRPLAIDLGDAGSNANDPGDGDDGPNLLQNFPVITNVVNSGGSVQVQGYLDSTALSGFTLDFYAAGNLNLGGSPQAQKYLGSSPVATGADGIAVFDVTFPMALPASWLVSATATDDAQNTSELSPAFAPATNGVAGLSLDISHNSGTNIVSWPSAGFAYQLETAYSLLPPVQWQMLTNGIHDNGTVKSFLVAPEGQTSNQFFRLKLQ